ncbi:MAG TPA: HAD family phosphatase [Planctomycetaceae bacterium]|nr:HAD family phosphatase [Planctomycetaceae bacterium]
MLEPIRFVYFDLGNVLASFDVQRACQNVARRWAVDPADVRRLVWDSGLQDRFEHGEVSIDEFASTVRRGLKLDLATASTIELVDQLCDMFEPIEEMIDLVDTVRQSGMRLGILSNTCEAHWQWLIRADYAALRGPFDHVILSYEHGLMKPNLSLYQIAADKTGHEASSILFLDDRPDNVAAAVASGWRAHQFTDARSAREVLRLAGALG